MVLLYSLTSKIRTDIFWYFFSSSKFNFLFTILIAFPSDEIIYVSLELSVVNLPLLRIHTTLKLNRYFLSHTLISYSKWSAMLIVGLSRMRVPLVELSQTKYLFCEGRPTKEVIVFNRSAVKVESIENSLALLFKVPWIHKAIKLLKYCWPFAWRGSSTFSSRMCFWLTFESSIVMDRLANRHLPTNNRFSILPLGAQHLDEVCMHFDSWHDSRSTLSG